MKVMLSVLRPISVERLRLIIDPARASNSPIGALVMYGIPQRDARIYAEGLAAGKIVVLVGVVDRTVGERVRALLVGAGGDLVTYHAGRPYGTAFHGSGPGLR